MSIGDKIKKRRKELGKTLEEVGTAVGVGKSTVRKWEQGMIKNMRRDKIALLASALDIDPAELIEYTNSPILTLSDAEIILVSAYRAAEPKYKELALELLEEHPAKSTAQSAG